VIKAELNFLDEDDNIIKDNIIPELIIQEVPENSELATIKSSFIGGGKIRFALYTQEQPKNCKL
jgi:hypothetical protein